MQSLIHWYILLKNKEESFIINYTVMWVDIQLDIFQMYCVITNETNYAQFTEFNVIISNTWLKWSTLQSQIMNRFVMN